MFSPRSATTTCCSLSFINIASPSSLVSQWRLRKFKALSIGYRPAWSGFWASQRKTIPEPYMSNQWTRVWRRFPRDLSSQNLTPSSYSSRIRRNITRTTVEAFKRISVCFRCIVLVVEPGRCCRNPTIRHQVQFAKNLDRTQYAGNTRRRSKVAGMSLFIYEIKIGGLWKS